MLESLSQWVESTLGITFAGFAVIVGLMTVYIVEVIRINRSGRDERGISRYRDIRGGLDVRYAMGDGHIIISCDSIPGTVQSLHVSDSV